MAILTIEEVSAAAKSLVDRASKDSDFHARAIADPKAAVREVTGKDVPEHFNLRLVSGAGADLTLVLPAPKADSEELTDHDLEQVAGGRSTAANALAAGLAVAEL